MASHAYSTPASTSNAFRPMLLNMRRRALEDWIEKAITLLDSLDPDPDVEPSFTSLWDQSNGQPSGAWDELEPDGDDEMSLGWQDEGSQLVLRASHDDREHEHDGREDIYR